MTKFIENNDSKIPIDKDQINICNQLIENIIQGIPYEVKDIFNLFKVYTNK